MVTRKYHVGNALAHENEWIWGAYDRSTGELVLERLPDRTANTLLLCLARHVQEGSIIKSDGWLRHHSHDIVDGLGMMAHEWVNHRRGEYAYDVHTAYAGNRKAKFLFIILMLLMFLT